jgi:hypothetical protein
MYGEKKKRKISAQGEVSYAERFHFLRNKPNEAPHQIYPALTSRNI